MECANLCTGDFIKRLHPQDGCQTFYYNDAERKCLLVVGLNMRLHDITYDNNMKWIRFG